MAIVLVGSTAVNDATGLATVNIPYVSTAGNTLVVPFVVEAAGFTVGTATMFSSVSDSAGNTWHFSTLINHANPPYAQIDSAGLGEGVGAGVAWTFQDVGPVTSVSWHPAAVVVGGNTLLIAVSEWSGDGVVDGANQSHQTGGPITSSFTSGAVTLTDSDAYIAAAWNPNGNATPATFIDFSAGVTGNLLQYNAGPLSAGGFTATFPTLNSSEYVSAVVAIRTPLPPPPVVARAGFDLGEEERRGWLKKRELIGV